MRLSKGEHKVFEALLLLATEGSSIPPAPEVSCRIFEGVLDHAHREARFGVRLLLLALEWLPFLFGGVRFWVPFSRRSRASQAAYIEAIQRSRLPIRRALFKALSATVELSHYARPEVQRAIGYDAVRLNEHYRSFPPAGEAPSRPDTPFASTPTTEARAVDPSRKGAP